MLKCLQEKFENFLGESHEREGGGGGEEWTETKQN